MPLAAYRRLQEPRVIEQTALNRVIRGVSMGDYAGAALCVPGLSERAHCPGPKY